MWDFASSRRCICLPSRVGLIWQSHRKSIGYHEQQNQLPALKETRTDLVGAHAHVLQNALRRLDKAFQAFFRRVQAGQKPGFPRFRSAHRYDSFTYPDPGATFQDGRLYLSKIGQVRIKLHRPLEGTVKTTTIKREGGKWYVFFAVEVEPKPLLLNERAIGIDVGLCFFATLSDGTEIPNPRYYQNAEGALRVAQRRVSRRKKGSNRRRKAVRLLQKAHCHVYHQRADFHHRLSRWLVEDFGLIVVEDLNVESLTPGLLSKYVHDAGWSNFIAKLTYKAANAGRQLVWVDPRGTSQTCLCGATVTKELSDREHVCRQCGLLASRDHVSAQVILQRALGHSVQASTECSNAA